MSVEEFITTSLELLRLEKEAEEQQNDVYLTTQLENPKQLEAKGVCIQKLQVAGERLGLYGRHVVSFELPHGSRKLPKPLPSSSITTGSIVAIFAHCKRLTDDQLSGVVVHSSSCQVQVAFDELSESVDFYSFSGSLQLVKISNYVTYRRMKASVERLKSSTLPPSTMHLVEVLFGETPLGLPHPAYQSSLASLSDDEHKLCDFSFINSSLDGSQKKAVLFALSQPEVAVIHGPPGTGKTTAVLEVILQAVLQGLKVLACAPSNIAVDNLVERLAASRAKVVRIGHPARLVEAVQCHSLDALLTRTDSASIIKDIKSELESALVKCGKARGTSDKRRWRTEIKTLRKELKGREKEAVSRLLAGADVVLATTNGASRDGCLSSLPEGHFGMVVIDECAQSIEASCWIPMLHSCKCVLAGDHKQLPPTIISKDAAKKGLSVSLMERLVLIHGDSITSMLTTQYRMNQKIMQWPSDYLYGGLLQAHESVAKHKLTDLLGVSSTADTEAPLVFIDTAGLGIDELDTADEESKGNEGEADLVAYHLKNLLEAGVSPKDIAVISPYNLQVELIRQRLPSLGINHSELEVRSVDGFQGREKEAVVISFTRSNSKGVCGFLAEQRRSNVAITRARRHLTLIGDSVTLSNEPFIKGLLEYCSRHGEVRGAQDYLHAPDFEEHHLFHSKPSKSSQPKHIVGTAASAQRVKKKNLNCESFKIGKARKLKATSTREEQSEDEALHVFRDQLDKFQSNTELEFSFPASLSGHQRKLIHELCEEMGLQHVSEGLAHERHITVSKISSSPSQCMEATSLECESNDNLELASKQDSELVIEQESMMHCEVCLKKVPSVNFITHEAICKSRSCANASVTQSSKKSGIAAGKQRKSRKKTTPVPVEDDLDALLAEMTLAASQCCYGRCTRTTNLIRIRCMFCHKGFCVEHSIPEVHGCGEEAKKHARKETAHPRPSKGVKREVIQKRLEKKLDKMSSERQSTSKPKPK